jgi:MFS family permease
VAVEAGTPGAGSPAGAVSPSGAGSPVAAPSTTFATPADVRRARMAVAALFFTNGALFANVVPRYPEVKAHVGLSKAAFGSAVAAFPLGALLAGLFAAALIGRYRSSRVATVGVVLLGAALFLVSVSPSWLALAGVVLVAGAVDAVVDVAQNAHGLRVQRLYGRSIVNSFHGVWSIGAIAGGLMGAAAAGLGVPLGLHLAAAGALCASIAFGAYRFLLPGPEDAERIADGQDAAAVEGHPGSPATAHGAGRGMGHRARGLLRRPEVRLLVALGTLAACGAVVEDAASSWGAMYLGDRLGATAVVAGLAFVAFQAAMTAGRLLGDRIVDRLGEATVVRAGGAVAALGMGVALALPTVPSALVGYGLAGVGVATLVPAAMHAADEVPGLPPGVGLTVVSWLLRVGFLLSPPLVGLIADASSLRAGLLSVVVAGLVVVLLGGSIVVDRTRSPADPVPFPAP